MMAFRTLRSKCALLATVCVLTVVAAKQAAADTITLQWDPSSTTVGYRVHVGTASGQYSQHLDAGSSTQYAFTTAVAGQRYCFAVSAYLLSSQVEGPNSVEVCGYSDAAPTLQNPGTRSSTVGQPTSLQLVGSDPQSQPLTYSATGLPPGLSVQASTGYISGTGTTSGTYNVTARASDGTLQASQQFTWIMNATGGGTSGGDTTRPVATITSPTSNSSYTASGATLNLGGTASDNVGVTQVRWSSDLGSGVASGTSNWSASGIPLQNGTNVITVTAFDAAGNSGADTVTVTYSGTTSGGSTGGSTGPDTTRPTIAITGPTSGDTFSTSYSSITVTGVAADNVGVARVMFSNDQGGVLGQASGTTNWSTTIALVAGTNYITVRSYDAAGNQSAGDFLTVTRSATTTTPPPTTTGDTTRPVATITSPTLNSSYTASGATMNLGGTATDNVGVTQVRWSSDRGGSGVASGTSNWSVSGIPLQTGTNNITVTAIDAAGNSGVDTVAVTYAGTTSGGSTGGSTGPDTTRPTILITGPTAGDTLYTSASSVTISGTAADNVGVVRVMYSNDQSGVLGQANGTSNWSIPIALVPGTNYITVRSYDAAGNQSGGDFLTITRQ
jgi:hypothetical protein